MINILLGVVVMETEKVGQKRKSRGSEQKRVERKKEKDRGPTGRKRVKERNEEKGVRKMEGKDGRRGREKDTAKRINNANSIIYSAVHPDLTLMALVIKRKRR